MATHRKRTSQRPFTLTPCLRATLEGATLGTFEAGADHYSVCVWAKSLTSLEHSCGADVASKARKHYRRYLGQLQKQGLVKVSGRGSQVQTCLTDKGRKFL